MTVALEAAIVAALRPFFVGAVLVVFGIPITIAVQRWMPPCRLKRLLLDRTLVKRRPWVAWLFVIGSVPFMVMMAGLGLWLNG